MAQAARRICRRSPPTRATAALDGHAQCTRKWSCSSSHPLLPVVAMARVGATVVAAVAAVEETVEGSLLERSAAMGAMAVRKEVGAAHMEVGQVEAWVAAGRVEVDLVPAVAAAAAAAVEGVVVAAEEANLAADDREAAVGEAAVAARAEGPDLLVLSVENRSLSRRCSVQSVR